MLRRARSQDRGPSTEYLAFGLAGDVYAAPVSLVQKIWQPSPLTPVPRAPAAVMGIISVRGQLVTVIDLRRRMRLAEQPHTRRARILLVNAPEGETLGLYVDEVFQVYRLTDSDIEPTTSAFGGDVASYVAGIARPSRGAGLTRQGDAKAEGTASLLILIDLRSVLSLS
jgi:purine-binding chemotaxis protein CheW